MNGEIFHSLRESQTLIGGWRRHYNIGRLLSALGQRPPAPEATAPMDQRRTMRRPRTCTAQVGPLQPPLRASQRSGRTNYGCRNTPHADAPVPALSLLFLLPIRAIGVMSGRRAF
ncbi:transposase [Pikeienuella piscinae]|uniref:Transposase n=1 Tax=Pikeienuella piscinae TaxID=2748098 RepID=A0A7M3T776_9RHOB|nr:transposase [Pikeienuella piscinae]